MKRFFAGLVVLLVAVMGATGFAAAQDRQAAPQKVKQKVVVFYSVGVEYDHLLFAQDVLRFFSDIANKDNFNFVATTDWSSLNDAYLKDCAVMIWLNDEPHTAEQRTAFEKYMEGGGGWLGFHVSAFNAKNGKWTWFREFLGGGAFLMNSWPPLPATVVIDDRTHPVTKRMPATFESPSNEWYSWEPSPRLNKDVKVLATLAPSNFPLGFKDILSGGDIPVVWTNTKYRMVYLNMGHGDKILTSPIQNNLFEDALLWLLSKDGK